MKYFVIFLILIGFAGLFSLVNHAYGLWIPESPDTLLEQSQTVFVGTITSVNVIEFEKSSILSIDENGVEKQIIENYTLSLDQYTVSVEEFLKSPQNSTMTVLQPTTSIPGRIVPIGGFGVGDRVVFYLEKIDKENTYSPESFEIPKVCDAQSVLSKPRITLFNSFRMMQNGVQLEDNYTAGIPIQFVYDIDTDTLEETSYDFLVGINRIIDNKANPIFKEKIPTKSNQCEWIASAKWEITPTAGKHSMAIQITEEDGSGGTALSTKFFVKENISTENKPPLKQFKSGIAIQEIQCKNDLHVLTERPNGKVACVYASTAEKLGWKIINPDIHDISVFEVVKDDVIFDVEYTVKGGIVEDMAYIATRTSLLITIDSTDEGNLILSIPRTLIDSGHSNCDPYYEREEPFAVLINHEEVLFEEITTTSEKRNLSISFPENAKEIEIISFCLI